MDDVSATMRPGLFHMLALLPSCVRATWELAQARLTHLSIESHDILALNKTASRCKLGTGTVRDTVLTERIAFVIPRIAMRLPWRTDCLVQAIAAQHWLKNKGVPTQITIGVDRDENGSFQAHAWLKHGETIVTGGDISDFKPLLVPES